MKRLLILLIGAYVIGGWAFKVLKVLGWCLLLYVVGQLLWMWLLPGLLPV